MTRIALSPVLTPGLDACLACAALQRALSHCLTCRQQHNMGSRHWRFAPERFPSSDFPVKCLSAGDLKSNASSEKPDILSMTSHALHVSRLQYSQQQAAMTPCEETVRSS
eukprot:2532975-Amphidinium_carterae.1